MTVITSLYIDFTEKLLSCRAAPLVVARTHASSHYNNTIHLSRIIIVVAAVVFCGWVKVQHAVFRYVCLAPFQYSSSSSLHRLISLPLPLPLHRFASLSFQVVFSDVHRLSRIHFYFLTVQLRLWLLSVLLLVCLSVPHVILNIVIPIRLYATAR